jgi:hypothetical protein
MTVCESREEKRGREKANEKLLSKVKLKLNNKQEKNSNQLTKFVIIIKHNKESSPK